MSEQLRVAGDAMAAAVPKDMPAEWALRATYDALKRRFGEAVTRVQRATTELEEARQEMQAAEASMAAVADALRVLKGAADDTP